MPPTENPAEHTALAVEPVDPEIVDGVLLDASRVVVGHATAAIAILREGKMNVLTSCTYVMIMNIYHTRASHSASPPATAASVIATWGIPIVTRRIA